MYNIKSHAEKLNALCSTYHVNRMYLIGSSNSSNFTDKSDLDFLVEFKEIDLTTYFDNYIKLKEELKSLFNRNIDLLEEQTLKNPILIRSINNNKELVYG